MLPSSKGMAGPFYFCIPPLIDLDVQKKWTNYHEHYDQDANSTIYTNGDRMDAFVTFTIVNLGLGMLIGPLWIL
jgi:hypothetical protein